MIDALYARWSRKKDILVDPNYKPQNSIKHKRLLNSYADKLVVIFPSWHTHNFPINILSKRLAKKGWAVLAYDFHDQIIEPNEDMVADSFRFIRDTIASEIQNLTNKYKYQQIHLIGISLGNVPLALVADKLQNFTGATIVVGGDDLAIDMWYGLRTQNYRRAFEKLHISLRKLDNEWLEIAPANHVKSFANKKVKFVISLNDEFVMTKYQKKLADKIAETGADLTIIPKRFGHTVSIIWFCLFEPPL